MGTSLVIVVADELSGIAGDTEQLSGIAVDKVGLSGSTVDLDDLSGNAVDTVEEATEATDHFRNRLAEALGFRLTHHTTETI